MYKNQLQELAQSSCFNLPSYTCTREGPDHAPRFKATVNFNGDTYECVNYCTTLRQAEHSAAEVALNALATHGPSNSLAARILDETGVYKNLLQEVSQRVGSSLPTYTTFRSGLGHLPVFTCNVDLGGCVFTGESAKNKKQAEKNAAMSAWSSLKLLAQQSESFSLQKGNNEEQQHVTVARALQKFRLKARMTNVPFPIQFPPPKPKLVTTTQSTISTASKILPFICPKTTQTNTTPPQPTEKSPTTTRPHKFPAVEAAPYVPMGHFRAHRGIAPPVTMRNAIPLFSAPPRPPPRVGVAMPANQLFPVTIQQAVPVLKPMATQIQGKMNLEDVVNLLTISSPSVEEKTSCVAVVNTSPPGSLQTLKEEKSLKEMQI